MRVSAHDIDERTLRATVLLDGMRMENVVEADDRNGYVDLLGKVQQRKVIVDGMPSIATELEVIRCYGRVNITLSRYSYFERPHWITSRRKRRFLKRAQEHR
jgi:hypothetical protein